MSKLIKYGFKESYKSMIILFSASLLSWALITVFALSVDSEFMNTVIGIIIGVSIVFIAIGLMMVSLIMLIINIVNAFQKKVFSSEGHLMMMLPVKTRDIIISKILVNFIWIIGYGIIMIIGALAMALIISVRNGAEFSIQFFSYNVSFLEVLNFIGDILTILLLIILGLLLLLFCLTVVNCGKVKKGKVLIALLIYYGISEGINLILLLIYAFLPLGISIDITSGAYVFGFNSIFNLGMANPFASFNLIAFILYIGVIIGLYYWTKYLLENKLELA